MKHPIYLCGLGLFLTLSVLFTAGVPPEVLGFTSIGSLGCLLVGLLLGNLQRFVWYKALFSSLVTLVLMFMIAGMLFQIAASALENAADKYINRIVAFSIVWTVFAFAGPAMLHAVRRKSADPREPAGK